MKVLIVDDNKNITILLKEMLETEEIYNVMTADNGEEGYAAFLLFNPDIILTDIEMPVKNGIEMLKEIRTHNPDIKTIYMSADLDRYRTLLENEKINYNAGFLHKPLYFSNLTSLLHEYQK